jgi:tRNA threonylcarbamoyladenosine dehydratase
MEKSESLSRTALLTGETGLEKLSKAHVLVVGLGGVGSCAAEMICRAGIGTMTIVDGDIIQSSNRNRQLPALVSTEGKEKAGVVAARLHDINPNLALTVFPEYIKDQRMIDMLKMASYDYVVDAIDTLSPKIYLIYHSVKNNLRIVSSMGTGGKFDPGLIRVADISETHSCQLAYDIRKRLRRLGIQGGVKAIFSPEPVPKEAIIPTDEKNKKSMVGTISYMPVTFGCFAASVVIRDLLQL